MPFKKVSRGFQECFNEVLFRDFVVTRISSQLPEQKEGLFDYGLMADVYFLSARVGGWSKIDNKATLWLHLAS